MSKMSKISQARVVIKPVLRSASKTTTPRINDNIDKVNLSLKNIYSSTKQILDKFMDVDQIIFLTKCYSIIITIYILLMLIYNNSTILTSSNKAVQNAKTKLSENINTLDFNLLSNQINHCVQQDPTFNIKIFNSVEKEFIESQNKLKKLIWEDYPEIIPDILYNIYDYDFRGLGLNVIVKKNILNKISINTFNLENQNWISYGLNLVLTDCNNISQQVVSETSLLIRNYVSEIENLINNKTILLNFPIDKYFLLSYLMFMLTAIISSKILGKERTINYVTKIIMFSLGHFSEVLNNKLNTNDNINLISIFKKIVNKLMSEEEMNKNPDLRRILSDSGIFNKSSTYRLSPRVSRKASRRVSRKSSRRVSRKSSRRVSRKSSRRVSRKA